MYKYVIVTYNGTLGMDNINKIYYAGDKIIAESKFAQDIYNATLFNTAAEATELMDHLTRKFTKKAFSIGMASITLTLM